MVWFCFALTLAIGLGVAFFVGWTVSARRSVQASPGTSNGSLQPTHGSLCTPTSEDSEPATSMTNFRSQPVKTPKPFNGDADCFREWSFSVELALRSYGITYGRRQVDFPTSFLAGSALLWFLARRRAGAEFEDWPTLETQLEETFGPLHTEEDSRLDLFSLTQTGSLDDYIREFSRLSLSTTDLDELSRALLFVRGLSDPLRSDTMREHPTNLSQAIRAARTARRCSNISCRRRNVPATTQKESQAFPLRADYRRKRLDDSERERLKREGRCFKCRKEGHIS